MSLGARASCPHDKIEAGDSPRSNVPQGHNVNHRRDVGARQIAPSSSAEQSGFVAQTPVFINSYQFRHTDKFLFFFRRKFKNFPLDIKTGVVV